MNFLILGNGGREHAFAWKLSQSKLCDKLYIAPGNAGTALSGENVAIGVSEFEKIGTFCKENQINMVLPGPEVPLVEGITDFFKADPDLQKIPVIGPGKSGAQLEGSKAFAKSFMQRYGIPTAAYKEFEKQNLEEGLAYLNKHTLPVVLKADGLAAGKGVVISHTREEAVLEFRQMLDGKFGEAGNKVVVEEFLDGIELSVFVLTDGKDYAILPEAKDYKRIGKGDTGLNTGGMGAVSPVPFADVDFMKKVEEKIVRPTIKGIQEDRLDYQGFIFFGLIKVDSEPFVIEYNCRMGDPETQVVLPRLKNDLGDLLKAVADGTIGSRKIVQLNAYAVTTILVSGGYPEKYEKGKIITIPQKIKQNQQLFYAGAVGAGDKVQTSGGRVMAATAVDENLEDAIASSRALAKEVDFEKRYFRNDIGWEFVD